MNFVLKISCHFSGVYVQALLCGLQFDPRQASPCDICPRTSGNDTVFLYFFGFYLYISFYKSVTYLLTRTRSYQKDKRTKPGNLPYCKSLSEIMERCLHFVVFRDAACLSMENCLMLHKEAVCCLRCTSLSRVQSVQLS